MELPNIIRLNNYLSQNQYTKAASISANTARNRINSKLIATLQIDGQLFIDIEKSPIATNYYKRNKKHPPPPTSLPDGIDKHKLVHISSYSRKTRQTANKFYKAILSGKFFGLVIAGEVFCYKEDMVSLQKL